MTFDISRRLIMVAATGSAIALSFTSSAFAITKLTFLVDNSPSNVTVAEALASAFSAKNPDISVEVEVRAGGAEGDNIMKTRLAMTLPPSFIQF